MILTGYHIDCVYPKILHAIIQNGEKVEPRGMLSYERRGVTIELLYGRGNILSLPARKLNYHFSVAEWIWMLLGRDDLHSIAAFNKQMRKYSDDGQRLAGAYGPKLQAQLPWVIHQLEKDRYTRQAVLTIWREQPPASRDIPCTISMQFLRRPSGLEMIVFMRSNDAWLGLPYDIFNFTQIQNYVATALNEPVSRYTHMVGSLHLYNDNMYAAHELVDEGTYRAQFKLSPPLSDVPPELNRWFEQVASYATEAGQMNLLPDLEQLCRWTIELPSAPPWNMYMRLLASRFAPSLRRAVGEPYTSLLRAQT